MHGTDQINEAMFKPGDRVRCIDNTFCHLLIFEGEIYTVDKVLKKSITLKEFPAPDYNVANFRFEKVSGHEDK